PPPVFQQPQFQPPPVVENEVDDVPPGQNPANPRGPVFNSFPPPQVVGGVPQPPMITPGGLAVPGSTPVFMPPQNGQPAAMPSGFPGAAAPTGVAIPGMIVQPPQQPGQPGVQQPGVPVRRPGGPS